MKQWKFIRGSKYLQVNEDGNVRVISSSIVRKDGKPYTIKEHIIKPYKIKCGYLAIHLHYDLDQSALVHRLVMEAFCPIDNMESFDVNHKDGDKTNNKLSNLEWCTKIENMAHARNTGLFHPENRFGEKHPMCKLSSADVQKIRDLLAEGKHTQHSIAVMYGVNDTTIHEIKYHKTRKKG